MKFTIKPTTRILLLTLVVAATIAFATHLQSMKTPDKLLSVEHSVHTDSPFPAANNQNAKKQPKGDVSDEIASLKAEIRLIKTQLAQQSALLAQQDIQTNVDIFLNDEEIQAVEAAEDDYEMTNEMYQAQVSDQIESLFAQQEENTALSRKNEAIIEQSLGLDQNDLASIVDLRCKSSLCRIELKYDLTAIAEGEDLDEGGHAGFSTTISSLLDAAVSREINEVDQTGIAVIFLGEPELGDSLSQL